MILSTSQTFYWHFWRFNRQRSIFWYWVGSHFVCRTFLLSSDSSFFLSLSRFGFSELLAVNGSVNTKKIPFVSFEMLVVIVALSTSICKTPYYPFYIKRRLGKLLPIRSKDHRKTSKNYWTMMLINSYAAYYQICSIKSFFGHYPCSSLNWECVEPFKL